jgi:hypothetical protein
MSVSVLVETLVYVERIETSLLNAAPPFFVKRGNSSVTISRAFAGAVEMIDREYY